MKKDNKHGDTLSEWATFMYMMEDAFRDHANATVESDPEVAVYHLGLAAGIKMTVKHLADEIENKLRKGGG